MHATVEFRLVDLAEGKSPLEDLFRIGRGVASLDRRLPSVVQPRGRHANQTESAHDSHDDEDGGDRVFHGANDTGARG